MDTQELLTELHTEHNRWQAKIKNYKDELKRWDEQLLNMVPRLQSDQQSRSLERFQNQIIIQNEVLDIMRHDFKQYENEIEFIQNHKVDKTEDGINSLHDHEEDKLLSFEHNFDNLRKDFKLFTGAK
ncbi:MAG TPA: hypothetical protein PK736_06000 [Bacteroidia bacterium]|nr:hypothetical protein [Bacteroidota bacterium]MBL0052433.1 hypothetical protein [Bacteroidota bacterium]HRC32977.1 hypothetical protein [Bacteroidia bacterium]